MVMMLVFCCSVINISCLTLLLQAELVSVCVCVSACQRRQEVINRSVNYW